MRSQSQRMRSKAKRIRSKTQRINVSLDPDDLEIVQFLSLKQKLSMSAVINKMVHDWLVEFEEIRLIKKIEEREKENNPLISHEEFWETK